MAFKDLDEFYSSSLPLPISGKVYIIRDVDAKTGLWMTRMFEAGIAAHQGKTPADVPVLDDDEEKTLYERALGERVYDEMMADGVSWGKLKHAAITAMMWHVGNIAAAERFWEAGADPEAGREATGTRASRRASKAVAKSAPSRASRSTTTDGKPKPQAALPGA
ncbi:MAG: hypothetical protein HOQ43_10920 [Glycomyces artemisiae]|uniref:DUF7426 domain-containing protein n=1 Tax=Glycomyces artemisiae TaxID=1076443 RepID=A0A850CB78_9ACTN|nr:hypothetical protein [Glycomyces artemisiae]